MDDNRKRSRPEGWRATAGTVLVVEAESGERRREWLAERVAAATAEERGRGWVLDCGFDLGGPWAGIQDLFASLLPDLRTRRPELLRRHDYELVHVVPALKRELAVRNPTLTDVATSDEKVRNYPADRAYRIVHGLIDLLAAFKGESREPWLLACDGCDTMGHIGRVFLRELMRRRGKSLGLALIAAVDPGRGTETRALLGAGGGEAGDRGDRGDRGDGGDGGDGGVVTLDLPPEPAATADRGAMLRRLKDIETRVAGDRTAIQIHLPAMVRLCLQAGAPERAAIWQYWGLEIFNTLGFYEDAIRYGESVLACFRTHPGFDRGELRWATFVKLFMSYVALDQPDRALRLAEEEAIGKVQDSQQRSRLSYLLAMLHARYLPDRDLHRGEDYLEQGLAQIQQAEMSPEERHFQSVFNRNGLAMIRHFQGRYDDAMELCREGFRELQAHLRDDRHRLHRSVLLYNMAQVYSAVGAFDDALRHFSMAMELDPNYSEYYNDRGSIYLRLGRLAEAESDYRQAIDLSPPYHEVYTNLGQCCRRMGRFDDAIGAYAIALDLNPGQALALAGRAQCHDALGRVAEAEADYAASLALDPRQWEALANLAVLRYTAGDVAGALSDLDSALQLAPQNAELYQNRALAKESLGDFAAAARDLETYLRLQPEADDRRDVELKLRAINQSCLTPEASRVQARLTGG